MNLADRARAMELLAQIREDVADDVKRFDGESIEVVGAWMGCLSAAVYALAEILTKVIAEDGAR